MLLLSCYTGLSYVDVCELRAENIKVSFDGNLWIIKKRHKTNVTSNIRLLDIPKAILQKYDGKLPDGKILPIISNQKMNDYLKEIATVCGINKKITYHVARHTFGSIICLSQGIPIETVSKIMGHKHIKTTQRYAKVTQDKIDRDVDRLGEAIEGKFSLYGIDTRPSTIRKDITHRKSNPSWKQAEIIKQMMEG